MAKVHAAPARRKAAPVKQLGSSGADAKAQRIARIEQLMLTGQWERGSGSDGCYAIIENEFGVGTDQVKRDAAEAGRNIRRAVPDGVYRDACLEDLEGITRAAVESEQYGPAVAAIRLRLDARGLLVKARGQALRRLEEEGRTIDAPTEPVEIVRSALQDHRLREILKRELDAFEAEQPETGE